ncbi:hypothetical protein B0H66DRAFT_561321 [Apodospora peruviana]|uniref:JmjC domain-containing protein n=1 Tax=Apodospora peruviana TaxID=516989 RepID=A0AAE0M280_9PEZI|nr:hypothetical protein B0H66DRAFT_561321 [Apodospora peruviana]
MFYHPSRPAVKCTFSGFVSNLRRQLHPTPQSRRMSMIAHAAGPVDVATFKRDAFDVEKPLVMPRVEADSLPAARKWFTSHQGRTTLTPYLMTYSDLMFPYEFILTPPQETDFAHLDLVRWLSTSGGPYAALAPMLEANIRSLPPRSKETQFLQFDAPLALLDAAIQFGGDRDFGHHPQKLYIAQAPLDMLPDALRDDVPTPTLVKEAGKGDVYNSSIWLGLEPTYTTWHRDPNPNLFCQMCSSKVVRVLPPQHGEQVYIEVLRGLGLPASPRIRGAEMMQGKEKQALQDAIWGDDAPYEIKEAVLGPGDTLFIPKGWWHSVKSLEDDGRLNASVNWWFR